MKWLLMVLVPLSLTSSRIDFQEDQQDWYVLNDGVMGGRSTGNLNYENGILVFKGKVSLENNGGFASIRNPWKSLDLSGVKKIKIKYRSSGQNFAMTLEKESQWYLPYYKADIPISKDWTEISLKPSDFQAYQVGRKMDYSMTKEKMGEIIRLGFISNDKAATEFTLEIDYIEIYS